MFGHNGKLGTLIADECQKIGYQIKPIPRDCLFQIDLAQNQIIVDVSSPIGTKKLIEALLFAKAYFPLIIGTTGDLPWNLIEEYKKYANVIVSSNFSVGINMVNSMLEHIDAESHSYWKADILDIHHMAKVDAPSGTAKKFKSILEAQQFKSVPIQSERIGNIVGTHTIHLDSEYEEVTINHNAKDRRLFAKGCIKLIKSLIS